MGFFYEFARNGKRINEAGAQIIKLHLIYDAKIFVGL
jgi:hypothetical protein